MFVNVGDKVERGSPLFCHKDNPEVPFVSPCKGFVKEINRGEKRALLSVVIDIENVTGTLMPPEVPAMPTTYLTPRFLFFAMKTPPKKM